MKERSTDVLNPSAEVKQITTCLLLFLMIHQRGEHNIEYQLTFPGSNFIFHDSRGIEAGSEDELKTVKEFIQRREQFLELKDQLHVIWYSLPSLAADRQNLFYLKTGTVSQWMINVQSLGLNRHSLVLELAEVFFVFFFPVQPLIMSFFQVPVVLIFTKFDALELKCYSKLREEGKSHEEASTQVLELANKTFQDEYLSRVLGAKFPPKTYVCLSGEIFILIDFFNFSQILGLDKEENQCSELSEKTTNILSNDFLANLFVSTQKNNLDLCIEKAIKLINF